MHKSNLVRYILISATLVGSLAVLANVPTASTAMQWNWATIALIKATFAGSPTAAYDWSDVAITEYQARATTPEAQARLLDAYQMRWRSAAQVGHVKESLSAYELGHGVSTAVASKADCTPTSGARFEVEDFTGVQAGTAAIPALVDGHQSAILFLSQPLTETICLKTSGMYTIGVMAANMVPSPIELHVVWDGWQAGVLTYGKGDGSFSLEQLPLVTTAGAHTLGLVYANDFSDPESGVDRNAVIDYASVIKDFKFDEH